MRGRGKTNGRNFLGTPRVARGDLPLELPAVIKPPFSVRSLHEWQQYSLTVYENGQMSEDEYCMPVKQWFKDNWDDNPTAEMTQQALAKSLEEQGVDYKLKAISDIDDGIPGIAVYMDLMLDQDIPGELGLGLVLSPDKSFYGSLMELSIQNDDGRRTKDHAEIEHILKAAKGALAKMDVPWVCVHAYSSADARFYMQRDFAPKDYFVNPEQWRQNIDAICEKSSEVWTTPMPEIPNSKPMVTMNQLKGFQKLLRKKGTTPKDIINYELEAGDLTGIKLCADLPGLCRFDAWCQI